MQHQPMLADSLDGVDCGDTLRNREVAGDRRDGGARAGGPVQGFRSRTPHMWGDSEEIGRMFTMAGVRFGTTPQIAVHEYR